MNNRRYGEIPQSATQIVKHIDKPVRNRIDSLYGSVVCYLMIFLSYEGLFFCLE